MGFLVKFKVSEILCVTMFNTICTSSFDTKFIHRTMETTQSMVMDCISTPHMVVFLVIVGTTLGEVRANQFGSP